MGAAVDDSPWRRDKLLYLIVGLLVHRVDVSSVRQAGSLSLVDGRMREELDFLRDLLTFSN